MPLKKLTSCILNKVFVFFLTVSLWGILYAFKKDVIILIYVYVYVCVVACGARATENCESHPDPNTGAGNWTPVLWKSRKGS